MSGVAEKLILGGLFALFVATFALSSLAPSHAASAVELEVAEECPVHAKNYRQAIVIRGPSPKRILLRADSACGAGPGMPLRLDQVELTIESDGKRFARIESPRGLYSSTRKRLLLDHVMGPVEPGCIGLADNVLVDLDHKQLRSADGWALNLNSSWAGLRCLRAI